MLLGEDNAAPEIQSSADFCKALSNLLSDRSFPADNKNTRQFIESMQAWLVDVEGKNSVFDGANISHITWDDLYKLLQASAIYE